MIGAFSLTVAMLAFCLGFLAGCWWVATRQAQAACDNALYEKPGAELEEPGLCRQCWGDCPPDHCKASDPTPAIDASDEWTALRARFPLLTPAQLAEVLKRRCQERHQ